MDIENFLRYLRSRLSEELNEYKNFRKIRYSKAKQAIQSKCQICDIQCIFVLSPGRSGTKWLTSIIAENTPFLCHHAPKPCLASSGFIFHQGIVSNNAIRLAFYSSREPYLLAAATSGLTYFDADCKNLPFCLEIAQLLPNSRFIHLVRHPYSFIRSGYSRGYYRHLSPELWGHLEPNPNTNIPWTKMNHFEKIAWFWNEANQISEKLKTNLTSKRTITIISENMFRNLNYLKDTLSQLEIEFGNEIFNRPIPSPQNTQPYSLLSSQDRNDIESAVNQYCSTLTLYYDEAETKKILKTLS